MAVQPADAEEIKKELEKMFDHLPGVNSKLLAEAVFNKIAADDSIYLTADLVKNDPSTREASKMAGILTAMDPRKEVNFLYKNANDLKPNEFKEQLKELALHLLKQNPEFKKLNPQAQSEKIDELNDKIDNAMTGVDKKLERSREPLLENTPIKNMLIAFITTLTMNTQKKKKDDYEEKLAADTRRQWHAGVDSTQSGGIDAVVQSTANLAGAIQPTGFNPDEKTTLAAEIENGGSERGEINHRGIQIQENMHEPDPAIAKMTQDLSQAQSGGSVMDMIETVVEVCASVNPNPNNTPRLTPPGTH